MRKATGQLNKNISTQENEYRHCSDARAEGKGRSVTGMGGWWMGRSIAPGLGLCKLRVVH